MKDINLCFQNRFTKLSCFFLILFILSSCADNTSFTITLKPNGGDVAGAKVILTKVDVDSPMEYQKTAESSVIVFKRILTGLYKISVEHDDYFPFEQRDIKVENNDSGFIVDLFLNGPVIFELVPNFGSVRGAKVILSDLEGNQFVGEMNENIATFKKITPGEHNINIHHEDYFDFRFGGFDAHSLVGKNVIQMYRRGTSGGYVFYDKGSNSDGWRYLETTHAGWEFVSTWDNAFEEVKRLNQKNRPHGAANWRLPSKEELNWMYQNLMVKGSQDPYANHVASFQPVSYWTDTQRGTFYQYAWCQTFDVGNMWAGHQHINARNENARVRVVRRF